MECEKCVKSRFVEDSSERTTKYGMNHTGLEVETTIANLKS
jgi:hypothetical protein